MNPALQKVTDFFLDILFPEHCQNCGLEGTYLCLPCQTKIMIPPGRCLACSRESLLGQTHGRCRTKNDSLAGIMVAADYGQKSVRNLIWYLKYHSVKKIGEVLATVLADFLAKQDLLEYFERAVIVPVPLHKRRERERGYNQAAVMGQELAKKLGFEFLPLLRRTAQTKRQVDLPREARFWNVMGHFTATPMPSLCEKRVILIDDVASTGATLSECARVLRAQGASEIWGLVVARN